jgi:sugar phosphate isomerase/epimerase
MKVGLYSITYLGVWYRGGALTMPEVVDRAIAHGYDGIEVDGKRPHGSPMDWDDRARREFRALCADKGIEIVGVASNNDFSSPIPEYREAQLLMVREQIRLCRDLGGRAVRLFFAWPGVTLNEEGLANYELARGVLSDGARHFSFLQKWEWIRAALVEAAQIAASEGVMVALQNHTPVLRTYRDMVTMIRDVDSPALGASLDVSILERQDDDYITQAVRDTGALQVISHFGGEFRRDATGRAQPYAYEAGQAYPRTINFPPFVRALKEVGYDGFLSFEFCHPALNDLNQLQGIGYVDEQSRLAAEYMRSLMIAEGAYTGGALATAR